MNRKRRKKMELFSYISAILNKLVSTLQLLLSHKNRPSLISNVNKIGLKKIILPKLKPLGRIYFHVFRLNTITKMKSLLSTITSIVLSCFLKHFMNTIRIIGKFIMILLLKALKQDHFTPIMDFGILSELSIHYTA